MKLCINVCVLSLKVWQTCEQSLQRTSFRLNQIEWNMKGEEGKRERGGKAAYVDIFHKRVDKLWKTYRRTEGDKDCGREIDFHK